VIVAVSVFVVVFAVVVPSFVTVSVFLALALTTLIRFEWFVYALILLLPWYPFLDYRPPFRDIMLLSRFVLLAGVWVMRRGQGKSVFEWIFGSRLKKGVLLFAGVASVSLFLSSEHANIAAYRSWVRLLSYVAVFFALAGWIETRRQVISVLRLILISTIGVALFGLYQEFERSYTDLYFHLYPLQEGALEPWNGRITSLLFHFNSLAGYLNLALPLALACMTLAKSRALRILGMVCQGLGATALFFTGSRGGLIAYGGMVLISLVFLVPRRAAILRLAFSLALATLLVLALQERGGAGRLQDLDEFTWISRLALWGAAGGMFLGHPTLGVGYGNYRALYQNYIPGARPNELDAHNIYLQFLAETGVIGFLIFCILIVAFARIAVKLARSPDPHYRLVGIGVGGGLAGTLIHGMTDYIFNASPQSGALLWTMLALGVVAYQQMPEDHASRL
jgi:O-antigen ligase